MLKQLENQIRIMKEKFLNKAVEQALYGMKNNHGGPFGAVIVKDGKIIGQGCNRVLSSNDPTAHAEIVAIRQACQATGSYHLQDAVIYTSCEPCPMCMAAIYWAVIRTVYYSADREDAERIGFSDKFLYEELTLAPGRRTVVMKRIDIPAVKDLFREWENKQDKVMY